ncbi:MAG TPA: hypothetical protein VD886_12540, partial [Herpetosiphonaceae bacterium]|nr:hypothetical protein [Herpetosiphonaceae bacterium]
MMWSPHVINLGVPLFAEALAAQGAPVVQVDWQPPAARDPRTLAALARVQTEAAAAANARAVAAILAAQPALVGMDRAAAVVP